VVNNTRVPRGLAVVVLAVAVSFVHGAAAQQPAPPSAATGPATSPASKSPAAAATKSAQPSSPSAGATTAPEAVHPPASSVPANADRKSPPAPVKKVDLNNATIEQLKTLPTVGDAEAKKIIEHRPYKSKGELVTKAGLPEGVYHAVRNRVELQKPRKAAAKK
jgi:competence protein ComEA